MEVFTQNLSGKGLKHISGTDGILRCSRYAFGPNRLHYCGPDSNREVLAYMKEGVSDPGLETILRKFQTMYPYLKYIAKANKIRDPFDERVVEAYWIGNNLLEDIEKKTFYHHLVRDIGLKKRVGAKTLAGLIEKIKQKALPHHSFHVFNVFGRTGHIEKNHTLETMDSCRVSWGTVEKISGPFLAARTQPLISTNGKLALGEPVLKQIARRLDSDFEIEQIKTGDIITMHWGVPCEVISARSLELLKKYTNLSINLANQYL